MNVRRLSPSSTLVINERSDSLRRHGRKVFKMGLGQSPFPVPDPVVEALRQNAFQKNYLPVEGLLELREAVAQHHCRSFGISTTADHVLIGPGSKELMFILQLVLSRRSRDPDADVGVLCPPGADHRPPGVLAFDQRREWLAREPGAAR